MKLFVPAQATGAAKGRKDSGKTILANDECLSRSPGCFVEMGQDPSPHIPQPRGAGWNRGRRLIPGKCVSVKTHKARNSHRSSKARVGGEMETCPL